MHAVKGSLATPLKRGKANEIGRIICILTGDPNDPSHDALTAAPTTRESKGVGDHKREQNDSRHLFSSIVQERSIGFESGNRNFLALSKTWRNASSRSVFVL